MEVPFLITTGIAASARGRGFVAPRRSRRTDHDRRRLTELKVELDQYWDLLRQRRALREFGNDPDKAEVHAAKIVENYEQ